MSPFSMLENTSVCCMPRIRTVKFTANNTATGTKGSADTSAWG
jgi:hypothetical protein